MRGWESRRWKVERRGGWEGLVDGDGGGEVEAEAVGVGLRSRTERMMLSLVPYEGWWKWTVPESARRGAFATSPASASP